MIATAGYFIRQSGDRWALIRQTVAFPGAHTNAYGEETVLDGLPYERVVKLYWRYMRQWQQERGREERKPQPTLFPLRDDVRPSSQHKTDGRYREPLLFNDL